MTDFIWASVEGKFEQVKSFIENGADVNTFNMTGETVLYLACEYGHYDVVKLLIDGIDGQHKGADVNMTNDWGSFSTHNSVY